MKNLMLTLLLVVSSPAFAGAVETAPFEMATYESCKTAGQPSTSFGIALSEDGETALLKLGSGPWEKAKNAHSHDRDHVERTEYVSKTHTILMDPAGVRLTSKAKGQNGPLTCRRNPPAQVENIDFSFAKCSGGTSQHAFFANPSVLVGNWSRVGEFASVALATGFELYSVPYADPTDRSFTMIGYDPRRERFALLKFGIVERSGRYSWEKGAVHDVELRPLPGAMNGTLVIAKDYVCSLDPNG